MSKKETTFRTKEKSEANEIKESNKSEITETTLAQLQLTEQALQNLLVQKQLFQFELIETTNALDELKKTKEEDVFKIVGSLMIKTNKEELKKELERKQDLLNLRLKTIEKQENELKEKLLKQRDAILRGIKS